MKYRIDIKFGVNDSYFYGKNLFDSYKDDLFGIYLLHVLSMLSPDDVVVIKCVDDLKGGSPDGSKNEKKEGC